MELGDNEEFANVDVAWGRKSTNTNAIINSNSDIIQDYACCYLIIHLLHHFYYTIAKSRQIRFHRIRNFEIFHYLLAQQKALMTRLVVNIIWANLINIAPLILMVGKVYISFAAFDNPVFPLIFVENFFLAS